MNTKFAHHLRGATVFSGPYTGAWVENGSKEGRFRDWTASVLSAERLTALSERLGGHWEKRGVSFVQVLNTKYRATRSDTLPFWVEFSLAPC